MKRLYNKGSRVFRGVAVNDKGHKVHHLPGKMLDYANDDKAERMLKAYPKELERVDAGAAEQPKPKKKKKQQDTSSTEHDDPFEGLVDPAAGDGQEA